MQGLVPAAPSYPDSLEPLIDQYLRDVERRGCSPFTVSSYRSLLTAQIPPAWVVVADITIPAVRAWIDGAGDMRRSSVKWRWTALRAFMAWLDGEGLAVDPRLFKRGLFKIRVPSEEPATVTDPEVVALLRAAWWPYTGRPRGRGNWRTARRLTRNNLIIRTLYCTGLRVSELVALEPDDLMESDQPYLRVRLGKGGKDRIVPMPADGALMADLKRFVTDVHSARIFTITPAGVEDMLAVAAARAGITRRVYPHLFRHTFATRYLNDGGSELKLQKVLGHTTGQMTKRYVHFNRTDTLRGWSMKDPEGGRRV